VPVVLAEVEARALADRIEAVGTARANESVTITASVAETVHGLPFEGGQVVRRGEVVAELVSAEEAAGLSQARALRSDAERQYRRARELYEVGTETRATLDARVAERDAARARVEELEARLSDRIIRAPFDGVLGLRQVSPGAFVRPGDTITTLDDIDPIKVDFSVPERWLSALTVGSPIDARATAYPERPFRGQIEAIDTRVQPRTRSIAVRGVIENSGGLLRPGMLLSVELLYRTRDTLVVPASALMPVADEVFVFVIDDELAARRVRVRIGTRLADRVEIVEGLEQGQRVVAEGTQRVRPGSRVEPLEAEAADVDL
jgi:membrane fusion protein (multidrug efflux system)